MIGLFPSHLICTMGFTLETGERVVLSVEMELSEANAQLLHNNDIVMINAINLLHFSFIMLIFIVLSTIYIFVSVTKCELPL
jgi:hypothetical protein